MLEAEPEPDQVVAEADRIANPDEAELDAPHQAANPASLRASKESRTVLPIAVADPAARLLRLWDALSAAPG